MARTASLLVVVLGVFVAIVLVTFVVSKTGFGKYLSFTKSFVFAPESQIKESKGITNILVMGKGGQGHDAPDLTDTMFLISLNSVSKKIVYISIPRDIWAPKIRAKINSAYYWGNQKEAGGGLILAKSTVEEIVGQPVNYAVVLDFNIFERIVNVLGGVEVNVENSFEDDHYPIAGREEDLCDGDPLFLCRYETIKFEKGTQKMDGVTALKFVRSRYAKGDEGTDIARQARQQKVIEAIKNRALSPEVLVNPWKAIQIYSVVTSSIETDIDMNAQAVLARKALSARDNVWSYSIPEDLLQNPPISSTYDNQYVFIPVGGSWSKLHEWISSLIH